MLRVGFSHLVPVELSLFPISVSVKGDQAKQPASLDARQSIRYSAAAGRLVAGKILPQRLDQNPRGLIGREG